jgi:hypothetical protein
MRIINFSQKFELILSKYSSVYASVIVIQLISTCRVKFYVVVSYQFLCVDKLEICYFAVVLGRWNTKLHTEWKIYNLYTYI